LVFTTERIVCSLADIFTNFEYVPGGHLQLGDLFDEGGFTISELEISRAFLSLAEGLQFLHNVQRRLHLNLNPESIVLTATGKWKLCGFGFSLSFQQGDQQRIASPYFLKSATSSSSASSNSNNNSIVRLEPDLQYQPPEMTDGGYNPPGIRYLTSSTDAFSLGMTMFEVYRYNLSCTPRDRTVFHPTIHISNNDIHQHLMALDNLTKLSFSFLPTGIDRLIVNLLQLNVTSRQTINDIVNATYFVSGNQAIITTLESLHTRDLGTQSSQLMALLHQLPGFPPRVLKYTAIPAIGKIALTNPLLWEYALPVHRFIARILPRDQYRTIAAQYMTIGMMNNTSIEAMHAFLSFLEFIQESFDNTFFTVSIKSIISMILIERFILIYCI
jgi:SCY1-like protein 2